MKRSDLERVLQQGRSFSRMLDTDAVLFLGSPTDPLPRGLIADADLPPWSRLLWWYLRTRSDSPGTAGRAPNYETIMKEIGLGSRNTLSEAFQALRITRWITVLSQTDGNRHHLYLLHNLPLTFRRVAELDPDYTNCLDKALRSSRKHLQCLAQRVLDGAMQTAESDAGPGSDLYRLGGFSTGRLDGERPDTNHLWKNVLQRVHRDDGVPLVSPGDEDDMPLDFHDAILGLDDSLKAVAGIGLRSLPGEWRQKYLDELAVVVLRRKCGQDPIREPLAYLNRLLNRFRETGTVTLNGYYADLPKLLEAERKKAHRKQEAPLRQELQKLRSEQVHIHAMASRLGRTDEWMKGALDDLGSRINRLNAQLGTVEDDVN